MKKAKEIDPYLQPRIPITKNMDHAYLLEVDGLCPLCGKSLLVTKSNIKTKLYQIAHIYPNSPVTSQIEELAGLERLGVNCEDFQNKIALCKDCHGVYDDHVTKEEYLRLVDIKKKLIKLSNAKVSTSYQNLEDEIVFVINALSTVDKSTLKKMKLNYKGIKVSDKIEDDYMILRSKVEGYVCYYFNFVKEIFQNLESSNQIKFEIIASEVKTSFLKCAKETSDKGDIFRALVNWLKSKINGSSYEACEVIISYFVQDCEVFNEITK